MKSISATPNYSKLVTRMSYISFIIVYYGYMHECAELFRQLCKDSRKQWDENVKAIADVIMQHEEWAWVLTLDKRFSRKYAKFLLTNNVYTNFSVWINFKSEDDFKAGIYFLNKLEHAQSSLFEKVYVAWDIDAFDSCNKFLKLYISKGFSKSALEFNPDDAYTWTGMNYSKEWYRHFEFIDRFPRNKYVMVLREWAKSLGTLDCCYEITNADFMKYDFDCLRIDEENLELLILNNIDGEEEHKAEKEEKEEGEKDIFENGNLIAKVVHHNNKIKIEPFKIPINQTCTTIEPCFVTRSIWINYNIPSETDCFDKYKELDYFVNYLPNVSNLQTNLNDSIKLMADYGFFRDKKVYKNLSRIDSFVLSNALKTKNDVGVNLKLENAKIVVQTLDKVLCFKWNNLKALINEEDVFLNGRDLLIINNTRYFEINGIQVDEFETINYKQYFKLLSKEFEGLDVKISILDIKDKIHKYNSLNSLWCNFLSNFNPHYAFEIVIASPVNDKIAHVDYSECISTIKNIDENSTISVFINTYKHQKEVLGVGARHNYFGFMILSKEERHVEVKETSPDDGATQLCELLNELKSKHVIEFRSEGIIDCPNVVEAICEMCLSNSKLRDIELNLTKASYVDQILKSLTNNFIVKTVRLISNEKVTEETVEYAKAFRGQRVATEISMNTQFKRFRMVKKKDFSVCYP